VYDHFKYTYAEDSNTEEFFIPYIWAIIVTQLPCVQWDLDSVLLQLPIYEKVLSNYKLTSIIGGRRRRGNFQRHGNRISRKATRYR
jgi:hypothetical protein